MRFQANGEKHDLKKCGDALSFCKILSAPRGICYSGLSWTSSHSDQASSPMRDNLAGTDRLKSGNSDYSTDGSTIFF